MDKNTDIRIVGILKNLGVPANINGYYYLRYAIALMMADISLLNGITKRLYPMVAKKFNTSASKAERCIRHAVERGWDRGDINLQNKIFGYTVDANRGKPTNSEFISGVADYLNMEVEDE